MWQGVWHIGSCCAEGRGERGEERGREESRGGIMVNSVISYNMKLTSNVKSALKLNVLLILP